MRYKEILRLNCIFAIAKLLLLLLLICIYLYSLVKNHQGKANYNQLTFQFGQFFWPAIIEQSELYLNFTCEILKCQGTILHSIIL